MKFLSRPLAVLALALVATLVLFLSAGPGFSQQATPEPEPAALELTIAGQRQTFEVALDELYFPGEQAFRSVPAQPGFDSLLELASELLQRASEDVQLVLYPAGQQRTEQNRSTLANHVVVKSDDPNAVTVIRGMPGISSVSPAPFVDGYYIAEVTEPGTSPKLVQELKEQEGVEDAEVEITRQLVRNAIPNDPFSSQQWHIRPGIVEGADADTHLNVLSAWDLYRGNGVTIMIIDDGVEVSHPDLAPNWSGLGFNAITGTSSGLPVSDTDDNHGTACAGLAAGRGFNSIGITGAAPSASFGSVYLLGPGGSLPTTTASAIGFARDQTDVSSNSYGFLDLGVYVPIASVVDSSLMQGVMSGRFGNGIIFVWSAGNGRQSEDRSDYSGFTTSRYTIAVGAVGPDGIVAPYSEFGSCVQVCAPSSLDGGPTPDDSAGPMIATTDRTGDLGYNSTPGEFGFLNNDDYTNNFSGTSASCPMVAGVVALMLQANPNLTWRDVQEILMRTAVQTPTMVADGTAPFQENAAGILFSYGYGAGLVDATAATEIAATWPGLYPAIETTHSPTETLPIDIPDDNATGRVLTFEVETEIARVEHVILELSVNHTYRGDLSVLLVSPSGMQSVLAEQRLNDGSDDLTAYPFMTLRTWGENPNGTWRLRVADEFAIDEGSITGATLRLFGSREDIDVYITGLDREPPELTMTTDPGDHHIHPIGGTATDDVGVHYVEYRIDGSEWRRTFRLSNGGWWFTMGSGTAEVRAVDFARKVSNTLRVDLD